jgi:hypothetical protein
LSFISSSNTIFPWWTFSEHSFPVTPLGLIRPALPTYNGCIILSVTGSCNPSYTIFSWKFLTPSQHSKSIQSFMMSFINEISIHFIPFQLTNNI